MKRTNASALVFADYRHLRLDRAGNHALFLEFRQHGDPAVKDRLVLGNMGLVYREYRRRPVRDKQRYGEDLVSEGIFGLVHAVDKFDPAREVAFSTYAQLSIRQKMSDAAFRFRCQLYVPHYLRSLIFAAEAREKGYARPVEDLTPEVAGYVAEARRVRSLTLLSIDPITKRGGYVTSHVPDEVLALSGAEVDPTLACDHQEEVTLLERVLTETLSDRQLEVFRNQLGLDGEVVNFAVLAARFGTSRKAISGSYCKALRKVRNRLRELEAIP